MRPLRKEPMKLRYPSYSRHLRRPHIANHIHTVSRWEPVEQSSPRGWYLIRNYNKQGLIQESTIEVSISNYRVTMRLQSEPVSLSVGGCHLLIPEVITYI